MKQNIVKKADILLPNKNVDMTKWAVVACDQFTSEPAYWENLTKLIDGAPSTLEVVFPEAYLSRDNGKIINQINKCMAQYLTDGTLQSIGECFVLVERSTPYQKRRLGLVIAVDLEAYSFIREDRSLIRATEGTVVERIPPRVKIRENAPVELPHIMLLIDDRDRTVIEPLFKNKDKYPVLYDFQLNMGGGRVVGRKIADTEKVVDALNSLISDEVLMKKYGTKDGAYLFAVGDGNHSLATARACWDKVKAGLSDYERENHPARFALVEVVNLFDDGLVFEPIHRCLFNVDTADFLKGLNALQRGDYSCYTYTTKDGKKTLKLPNNAAEAVKLVQDYIDNYVKTHPGSEVDYVHGEQSLKEVTDAEAGRVGITLPPLDKNDLFEYVLKVGAFPRKTFSMGEAVEKRYYIESRKIIK